MAALSVIYSNFGGMVVSETRNGVESDYVSDTLGSTIGLLDSAGTMTDRWEYWPYGEVVSRTGTSVTPLTFLGVLGYFQDVLGKLFYVRARHFRADLARWLTVDPIWPQERAYLYCSSAPVLFTDSLGLDQDQCDQNYEANKFLCETAAAGCFVRVGVCVNGCAGGCAVTTLAYWLCMALCLATCAILAGLCYIGLRLCLEDAFLAWCLCEANAGNRPAGCGFLTNHTGVG